MIYAACKVHAKHFVEAGHPSASSEPLGIQEFAPGRRKNLQQPRWLGPFAAATARFLYAVNRMLMRLLFRVRAKGLEHLSQDRQWVLTPNHVSYLDPFAIAALLDWSQLRKTYWAGWTGVAFANPVMRFLSRLGKILPVEPTRAARSSLAFGAIILKKKKNLVWFPEGERSANGELQEFKPGIGLLAAGSTIPVVPCYLAGAFEAWPKGKIFPRPRRLRLRIGEPRNYANLSAGRDSSAHVSEDLRNAVTALAR